MDKQLEVGRYTVISALASSGEINCRHVLALNGLHAFAEARAQNHSDENFIVALKGWLDDECDLTFAGSTIVCGSTVDEQPGVYGSPCLSITQTVIENVLEAYALRVHNPRGQSFSELAAAFAPEIDRSAINKTILARAEHGLTATGIQEAVYSLAHELLVAAGIIEF